MQLPSAWLRSTDRGGRAVPPNHSFSSAFCTPHAHVMLVSSPPSLLIPPPPLRWCMYEFQYSALDRPWFLRNELAELLQLLCGGAQAETPSRWGVTYGSYKGGGHSRAAAGLD